MSEPGKAVGGSDGGGNYFIGGLCREPARIELAADELGLLKTEGFEKDRLTFHDPCQLARRGGVIQPQRNLLNMVAKNFVERNIPFDLVERESDLGGLWNINTPSGIVYESTHLVSCISATGFDDFPMLDDRTCCDAEPHPFTGEFVWTPERNHFGWKALLGVEPGSHGVDETAAPARAKDLSGLPPAFLHIGTLDLFLEENLEYTRRLTRAGVPVELHVIPGAYHGSGMAFDAPQSKLVADLRLKALARALGATMPG